MDKQSIYDLWVPANSIWSPWVKPVLFAHFPRNLPKISPLPILDLNWVPDVRQGKAIVVDLPGVESVHLGLALAKKGYRPVPLFNACSLPNTFIQARNLFPENIKRLTLVDVESILAALYQGCSQLQQMNLPDDAPPAFLLDAHRQGHSLAFQIAPENLFDNRSVVFITDFPSSDFLLAQGITSMIVVRQRDRKFSSDLTYVLNTWQQSQIILEYKRFADQYPVQPLTIWAFPGLEIWVKLIAHLHLRKNLTGAFGGFISSSSSG